MPQVSTSRLAGMYRMWIGSKAVKVLRSRDILFRYLAGMWKMSSQWIDSWTVLPALTKIFVFGDLKLLWMPAQISLLLARHAPLPMIQCSTLLRRPVPSVMHAADFMRKFASFTYVNTYLMWEWTSHSSSGCIRALDSRRNVGGNQERPPVGTCASIVHTLSHGCAGPFDLPIGNSAKPNCRTVQILNIIFWEDGRVKKFVYFYIDLMKSIFYKDVVKIQIYNHSKFWP